MLALKSSKLSLADSVDISYESLVEQLIFLIKPNKNKQLVRLSQALNKVSARPVYAPMNWPSAPISAMDGYAFNWQQAQDRASLKLDGACWPGEMLGRVLEHNACRISTGAVLPPLADTVIALEQAQIKDGYLSRLADIKQGTHVKSIGSDLKKGQCLIQAGERIKPRDLALLASVGINKLEVKADLKILLLNSGSEVIEPGEKHEPGKTYNANAYGLTAYIQSVFGLSCDRLNIADDAQQLKQTITHHAQHYDLILTTGGSSVGSRDYIRQILPELGESYHWKVQMKPAKPLSLAKIHQAWLLALPGNPVAAMVSMVLFGRLVLNKLLAVPVSQMGLPFCELEADFAWQAADNKMHWLLVSRYSEAGKTRLKLEPNQGASHLLSLSQADGWVQLSPNQIVQPADKVRFIAFDQLGL